MDKGLVWGVNTLEHGSWVARYHFSDAAQPDGIGRAAERGVSEPAGHRLLGDCGASDELHLCHRPLAKAKGPSAGAIVRLCAEGKLPILLQTFKANPTID